MAFVSGDRERARIYSFAAFVKDSASKTEIERLFQTDSVVDTHVSMGGVPAAVEWLRSAERSPERIIVDISGSARPLDELDMLADVCEPSVQVFVVGDRNDVGLFRNLLGRGVSDYIVKPLSLDLMRRTFFAADTAVRRTRHGKCVALTGTRGGVGVTSIAAHLARALVAGGSRRRVVYVDLNLYDGSGAGLLGHPGGGSFVELMANTDRLDQQFIERAMTDAGEGLFILNAELEYPEVFEAHEGAFTLLLDALGQYFHYVVVDMADKTSQLASETFEQADMVCAVTDNSVHSARILARLVRYVESRPAPPVVIPVLNHVRSVTRHQVLDKDFERATEIDLQLTIGFDAKGPALAENLGQPLAKSSEFQQGVERLAGLVTGEAVGSTARSWWRRLVGR